MILNATGEEMAEPKQSIYAEAIEAVERALQGCGLSRAESRRVTASANMGTYDVRVAEIVIEDGGNTTCRYVKTFTVRAVLRINSGGDDEANKRIVDELRFAAERAVLSIGSTPRVAHIGAPVTIGAVTHSENGAQCEIEITCKAWETWP